MNIVGLATIVAIDEIGKETVLYTDECNDICWQSFRHAFISNTDIELPKRRDTAKEVIVSTSRWKLFYGSSDIKTSPLNSWYPADGTVNVSTDYPVYVTGTLLTDPDKMTFRATIPAPVGSPRTINVIGLDITNSGSSRDMTSLTGGHLTILKLSTPCTQAVNVTLVVTYDLYLYPAQAVFDNRISSENYRYLKEVLKYVCDNVGVNHIFHGIRDFNYTPYDLNNIPSFGITGIFNTTAISSDGELTSDGMLRANPLIEVTANAIRYSLTFTDNATVGLFIKNSVMVGGGYLNTDNRTHTTALFYQSVRGDTDTNPVQNVYGQRNSPPGPSQDLTVNNTATMTGNPVFNTTNWVDPKYQKMVKLNITGTGGLGVATYNISVMNFIAGFAGNKWIPRTALLPQPLVAQGYFRKATNDAIYESLDDAISGGITYRTNAAGTHVLAASCLRTKTGVSIYEVLSGKKFSFNSANGLAVTAVSDGEISGGYYYITCANTGLWRINNALDTVELVSSPTGTDKAYQICKMNDANGSLWVLFDGGLCRLTNPSAGLGSLSWVTHNSTSGTPTFTYAGITDNNWANVTAMIVNPDNTSVYQFLFVTGTLTAGDASGNFRKGFVWWDTSTGVASNPSTSGVPYSGFSAALWTPTNLLNISDQIRCCANKWFVSGTTRLSVTTIGYYFSYGVGGLNSFTITNGTYWRYVPATINGVTGLFTTGAAVSGNNIPGLFISATAITALAGSTTLTQASSNIEFVFRSGANSFVTNMETASLLQGNLATVLTYLPQVNMLFSAEYSPNSYGVTPFILPPTHAKYATYKGAFWKEYGWDGINWVADNTGSKTITGSNEFLPFLDNLGVYFANGVSGTSFVAGEWFIFAIGNGIFKDNGVTYTANIAYSLYPTKEISITGNLPTTPMGALTDEPVTFSLLTPNRTSTVFDGVSTYATQNKGIIFSKPSTTGVNSQLVADQLIPASSQFDLRFKWASLAIAGTATTQTYGLYTGTGTYTAGVHFRFSRSTGALTVYNNNTLLATVASPDINGICRIVRDASNNIISYYNGVALHSAVNSTSQFVIIADAADNAYGQGWWDMELTYTEARRVMRIGSAVGSTGSYSPKFSSLTYSSLPADVKVYIGSGTPLTAILDYTSAGVALSGTGRVKVCPGAGWLIFHDSEPANPVSGRAVAHFVLNNQ